MFPIVMCLIGLGVNAQAAEFSPDEDYSQGSAQVELNPMVLANTVHLNGEYGGPMFRVGLGSAIGLLPSISSSFGWSF